MYSINILTSIIISVIALLIAFVNINPYKLKVKEYIVMMLLIVVTYMTIFLFNSKFASVSSYIIPMFFIYKKCHKVKESLVLGIVITLTIVVVDSFIGTLTIKLMSDKFLETGVGYYIACTIIALVLFPISKFVGKLFVKYKRFIVNSYNSKHFALVYIILLATFILFYVNINWNKSSNPVYLTEVNGAVFTVYGFIMVCICISIFLIMRKEEKFRYKQMEMDKLREYTENLEQLYMDMRKFRHDYINMISTMGGFIEDRDIDALEGYFNEHIYPLNRKINRNNYKLGLLKNIEISEIKSLISAKVIRAQELGLDIIIDVIEPITKINMDIIELSRCLGIIFDNAIEAALESEEKTVNIGLIKKKESVIIVVINTFKGEMPPLSKLFKDGFSTKGQNRGLGLGNLKDIVSQYKNITLDTYIKEDKFFQEIDISNN
ncbi:sensor histidine kinase [Clostridium cibarium]|uniref:GHKL domain-containing protein n=1 Tax=Clostridium cibarium TaxID=2762247 RepID=A0ABR8PSP5_9CLOT|nr:GHKL domain-containing protein [Clostridium cibarium]MBD7911168.1 GHKL domain-containing protein [Clostridium cibarium]